MTAKVRSPDFLELLCYGPNGVHYVKTEIGYNANMIRKFLIVMLLLAAAGTYVLSLISTRKAITWEFTPGRDTILYISASGGCGGVFLVQFNDPVLLLDDIYYTSRLTAHDPRRSTTEHIPWDVGSHWGFGYQSSLVPGPRGVTHKSTALTAPLWAVVVLFGIYPAIVFIRGPRTRRQRKTKNLCADCGYDLTGNESGVCPECGWEVARP
ncbi:MAG: hypothetical protein JSU63_11760 [Phycisphaerales bacterium]|nr:MAG: hypothetical protein JSU63_11760 [Phycisphaerales bacterium]